MISTELIAGVAGGACVSLVGWAAKRFVATVDKAQNSLADVALNLAVLTTRFDGFENYVKEKFERHDAVFDGVEPIPTIHRSRNNKNKPSN